MTDLGAYIVFVAALWLWAAIFFCLVQKPIFGLMNRRISASRVSFGDTLRVYRHGFVSDAIIASYLSAIPMLLGFVKVIWPGFPLGGVMIGYNIIVAIAMGLLTVADATLYGFWKSKIDASVFTYLRSLKGATASVSTAYLMVAVGCWLLLSGVYFAGAECATRLTDSLFDAVSRPWWIYPLALVAMALITGALFAIIRGLKIRPNNPSVVYFSSNPFLNHWALNPLYNIIYSLSTRDNFGRQFRHFPEEECHAITDPLFPVTGNPQFRLFNTRRPNVLLIVWESFGAEFCGALGGKPGVTPNIDRLAREGILFSRCTAGSFRTDRALVCLLSGFPGQPTTSVIRYTRKLPNLPGLARKFRAEGYETTAVHGGDLTIMHKSDYYLASGHDRLVAQRDIPSDAPTCKWGVQDGYMLDWLYDDIMAKTAAGKQWFTTFQTLSSHEPFNVPYSRLDDPIDNSYAYVDDAIGRFVDRLKGTPAWDNLLIAIVADHGLNHAGRHIDCESYAHIPLLFLGGAVSEPRVIDTIMSQTDLAATLLGQLDIDHSDFTYSRDVTADTYTQPFGFHTFVNGFMMADPTGTTVYDNVAETAISGHDDERERRGKAILQRVYTDLDKL